MAIQKWQQDEEFVSHIADLLETEEVQKLHSITHHYYSTRLDHSISVAYRSFCVGRRLNCNTRAIARAGLLHDLFYYDWRTTKFDEGTHAYVHPRIAYENAQKLTELSDLEKDIIIKHMWGATLAPPKYKESLIVTIMDKVCACDEALTPVYKRQKTLFRNKWTTVKHSILSNVISF